MATSEEISGFLKGVQHRAFKRVRYHIQDEHAALDIVQDSMIRLCERYGHKPIGELAPLFQCIVSTITLDWLRAKKVRQHRFLNFSDLEEDAEAGTQNILEVLQSTAEGWQQESSERTVERHQILACIEAALEKLPIRQREAFLLRYWEELDVAQTAAVMGCTPGSVKTHCFRAIAALSKTLAAQGVTLS